MTPCDEQLFEQESSQAGQMNRGEIEVEEERRVRAKRVPVLPTDKEKDESEIMHMTIRSQCATEDSHRVVQALLETNISCGSSASLPVDTNEV